MVNFLGTFGIEETNSQDTTSTEETSDTWGRGSCTRPYVIYEVLVDNRVTVEKD